MKLDTPELNTRNSLLPPDTRADTRRLITAPGRDSVRGMVEPGEKPSKADPEPFDVPTQHSKAVARPSVVGNAPTATLYLN